MTYTTRIGLEKIDIGSEVDTWGDDEHANLDRLDEAVSGVLNMTVSGDRTIVHSNTSTDEVHFHTFNVTGGSGGRIILPLLQSSFMVRNGSSGNITVTTNNSGTETIVGAGEVAVVFCDGINAVYAVGAAGAAMKEYVDTQMAAAKSYADGLAFSTAGLPTQTGNAGKFVTTNGATASWSNITEASVTNLVNDLANIRNFAVAMAAIL